MLLNTDEDALTTVGVDYGYFPPEGMVDDDPEAERKSTPILCGKDRKHRWYYALAVPCKGTGHPWPEKALAKEMILAGHRRYIFMSDGEPAILDYKRAVARHVAEQSGVEAVMENTSKGDSSGNGLAELAVKEVKAKTRTMAHAVQ